MECDFCIDIAECEANNRIATCWRFKGFKEAIKDLNSQMSAIIENTNNLIKEQKTEHGLLCEEFSKLETLARYAKDAVENDKWWKIGD